MQCDFSGHYRGKSGRERNEEKIGPHCHHDANLTDTGCGLAAAILFGKEPIRFEKGEADFLTRIPGAIAT